MKKTILAAMMALMGISSIQAQDNNMPQLRETKQGVELLVDGQPFRMLAGELHNSSTGSAHYMAPIWQRMADLHLNTVIAAVSWELIEPEEGRFDFTLVDEMLKGARQQNLKLVLLWFGSWKNGMSTYAPAWVKKNQKRFPLAQLNSGESIGALSTLGAESAKADAKAFGRLMQHIKEVDAREHTVLMVQIENEVGTLDLYAAYRHRPNGAMRDYSPLAEKAFKAQVPAQLISYLKAGKSKLHPAVAQAWAAQGYKTSGTWEEVFGRGEKAREVSSDSLANPAYTVWQNEYPYLTEELFNAWNYASYMEQVAAEGKSAYPLPLYVNCWIKQLKAREPGFYPSGGPQIHTLDIWRAAAPHIDLYGPDLYATDTFDWVCSGYTSKQNPLMMPETKASVDGAARAFYAFGRYNTLCYSPFGVDGNGLMLNPDDDNQMLGKTYELLGHLMPYIHQYSGTDRINGLLLDNNRKSDMIEMGNYLVMMRRFSTSSSQALAGVATKDKAASDEEVAGVLIIQTADNEFIVAGGVGSLVASFYKGKKCKSAHVGIESVDEITFAPDGTPLYHRLNGDETAYGAAAIRQGEVKAFKVRLYEY